MNEAAEQQLRDIVRRYGDDLLADPRRVEGLLRDLCGQHRREVAVLVAALKTRIPQELQASATGVPWEVLQARLTRRLLDDQPLTEEAARWAVRSWALALGLSVPNPVSAPPQVPQAWRWHSGGTAHDFAEWLSQARLPENRAQAEEALRLGQLASWLKGVGDQKSMHAAQAAPSLAHLLGEMPQPGPAKAPTPAPAMPVQARPVSQPSAGKAPRPPFLIEDFLEGLVRVVWASVGGPLYSVVLIALCWVLFPLLCSLIGAFVDCLMGGFSAEALRGVGGVYAWLVGLGPDRAARHGGVVTAICLGLGGVAGIFTLPKLAWEEIGTGPARSVGGLLIVLAYAAVVGGGFASLTGGAMLAPILRDREMVKLAILISFCAGAVLGGVGMLIVGVRRWVSERDQP
jgi:hypothetical protein